MAGSISLAGAQQFDVLGNLLGGGKVYWIQAGTTSTPQDAFYDSGLASPLPNPYTLEADGRIPFHYLADGQIKVRIDDSNGVTRFVQDNILVVGPSSGEGGGGGVDPTVVFQTGDCLWLPMQGTRTGWTRANGRTIGSASSGATERANADTSAQFVYLWTNFDNTICPVSTGRGANAAADFAANKTIQLLDMRGYVPGGLDDMGNSAAGRYANVPVVSGSVTAAGSVLGEATHTITKAESAVLTYTAAVTDPGHLHNLRGFAVNVGDQSVIGAGSTFSPEGGTNLGTTNSATTGITVGVTADAGGGAHNNVQKTILGSFYLKL
jgi:hypothetical protein